VGVVVVVVAVIVVAVVMVELEFVMERWSVNDGASLFEVAIEEVNDPGCWCCMR
jgi:hypothetical protein